MKRYLPYLILFLLLISSSLTYAVESAVAPSAPVKKEISVKPINQIPSKKDWEEKLGRKLNFKERLSLRILQKQFKKQAKKQTQEQESIDGFALAGLVVSLVGILFSFLIIPLVAVIAGVIAIVLSTIGMNRTQGLKGFKKKGRGIAIAGLVAGILVTVFWTVVVLALIGAFG